MMMNKDTAVREIRARVIQGIIGTRPDLAPMVKYVLGKETISAFSSDWGRFNEFTRLINARLAAEIREIQSRINQIQ